MGSALANSAWITTIAVPLGALMVSFAMALRADGPSTSRVIGPVVFGVTFGLLLLGIPLSCLTFAVAGAWVVLVRALVRALGVRPTQEF